LSTVETGEDRSAESGHELPASTTRRRDSRRRRISQDEEREIVRLYADNSTSTAEIRERFGIGDSSLYRVVQRHGVALRGHTGLSTRSKPSRAKPAAGTGSRLSAAAATPRTSARAARRSSAAQRTTTTPAEALPVGRASSRTGGGAQQRYEVRFQAESVFEATGVLDALRQAESLGATEIAAIAREKLAGRPGSPAPAPAMGTCASDLPVRAGDGDDGDGGLTRARPPRFMSRRFFSHAEAMAGACECGDSREGRCARPCRTMPDRTIRDRNDRQPTSSCPGTQGESDRR